MGRGKLTVIVGCMFSGKSERIVERVQAARSQGRPVAAFKHAGDDRYAISHIVTHSGLRIDAAALMDPAGMAELAAGACLVAIDEAQFFNSDLVEVCRGLIGRGCDVIVAGLDLDSWGEPFGSMPELTAMADEVVQTHSRCARCGELADHTQRLARIEGCTMIGGPESYEPRCAKCFQAPPAELRR